MGKNMEMALTNGQVEILTVVTFARINDKGWEFISGAKEDFIKENGVEIE